MAARRKKLSRSRKPAELIISKSRTKGGLLYRPDGRSVEGLYDAWGNPYVVALAALFGEFFLLKAVFPTRSGAPDEKDAAAGEEPSPGGHDREGKA